MEISVKNGDKGEKKVTDPRVISNRRLTNNAVNNEIVTGPVAMGTAFLKDRKNKPDKNYETCKSSVVTKSTERLIPKDLKPSISGSKIPIPIDRRRRHSSMNLLDSATLPVQSSSRRSSCVILLMEVQEEKEKPEEIE